MSLLVVVLNFYWVKLFLKYVSTSPKTNKKHTLDMPLDAAAAERDAARAIHVGVHPVLSESVCSVSVSVSVHRVLLVCFPLVCAEREYTRSIRGGGL